MTSVDIGLLKKRDIPAAKKIVSQAFGTFLGAADPDNFRSDTDYVGSRWRADPESAFVAELDGEIVGSNFAVNWGSVGFFGPLTIRPDLWDSGLGKLLVAAVVDRFDSWKLTHSGLFTFPQSAKHIGLYQQFGYWPRHLTAIMAKQVKQPQISYPWSSYSGLTREGKKECLTTLADLTHQLYPGLRLDREIDAVDIQNLGETVLIGEGSDTMGFAVCHCGAGTEAGNDRCYIKFAGVNPGIHAGRHFVQLLNACEALAVTRGLAYIDAGVNMARREAYSAMLDLGFRTVFQGVAMHRPDSPCYSRPEVFAIDDWR